MNLNELVLQMTFAASQAVQVCPVRQDQSSPEGNKEFRTLLDEKRTQAVQGETQEKTTSQPVAQTEVFQGDEAVDLSPLLTQMMAGSQVGSFQAVFSGQTPVVQTQQEPTAVEAVTAQSLTTEMPQLQTAQTQVQLPTGTEESAVPGQVFSPQTVQQPEEEAIQPTSAQEGSGKDGASLSVQASQPQKTAETDTELPPVEQKQDPEQAQTGTATEQPLFQDQEVMPQRVGDAPVLDTQSDRFETQMASQIKGALAKGEQHIQLRLTPEHLGQVVVDMSRSPEGVLHVVLHTENEQAMKVLTEHSNALGLLLQSGQQGEVRIEVRSPQSEERPWQQPDQNSGQNQGEQRQQEQRRPRQDSELFLQQLRLGLTLSEGQ